MIPLSRRTRVLPFAALLLSGAALGALGDRPGRGPFEPRPPAAAPVGPLAKALLKPLALYPKETQRAILELSKRPELIPDVLANPEKYRDPAGLATALPRLSAETLAAADHMTDFPMALSNMADHPGYVKLIGLLYEARPEKVREYLDSITDDEAKKIEPADETPAEAPPEEKPPPAGTAPAEAAGSEEAPPPTVINNIYQDPACAEELAALAAAFSQWAQNALSHSEAVTTILDNAAAYPYTAAAILDVAAVYPWGAAQRWVDLAEKTVGYAYRAGESRAFLEAREAAMRDTARKGEFWKTAEGRAAVLDRYQDYPALTKKVLEEHAKNPRDDVAAWKDRVARDLKIPGDLKDPGKFSQAASLFKKNPALQGKSLDAPEVARRLGGNPAPGKFTPGRIPAASRAAPEAASHANKAAAQQRKAWGAQAKHASGGRPGGPSRPGGGRR